MGKAKAGIIFAKTLARGWHWLLAFAGGIALFEFVTAVTFPSIGGTGTARTVFESLGPDMQRLLKLAPNLQAGFTVDLFGRIYSGVDIIPTSGHNRVRMKKCRSKNKE